MKPTHKRAILGVGIAIVMATAAVLPWTYVEVGVGSFGQAEFRINIVDESGKPIQNLVMHVVDGSGRRSPCYPVSDYYSDDSITSDKDGVLVFHHIGMGDEYVTRNRRLLTGHIISKVEPPEYECEFWKEGQVVSRARFADYFGWGKAPKDKWQGLRRKTIRWLYRPCSNADLPAHLRLDEKVAGSVVEFPVVEGTIVVPENKGGKK